MSKTACEVLITNGCAQRFKAAEASRARLWAIVLVLLTIIGSTGVVLAVSTLSIGERLARVEERVIAMQATLGKMPQGPIR